MGRADLHPLSARRLHAEHLPEGGGALVLDADASRHAQVLRLEAGDAVCLFDGRGRVADGTIESVERRRVVCRVEAPRTVVTRGPRVVLVQGAPKGKKSDAIVRMATELGVDALFLASSEHTVGRLDAERTEGKLGRLDKVALEATRQCERATVPELHAAASLLEAAAQAPDGSLRLCFWERGGRPLRDALPDGAVPPEVWLVVGPEGGLSDEELRGLDALGYVRVSLGPTVLRAETAAVAALAAVGTRLGREDDRGAPTG